MNASMQCPECPSEEFEWTPVVGPDNRQVGNQFQCQLCELMWIEWFEDELGGEE